MELWRDSWVQAGEDTKLTVCKRVLQRQTMSIVPCPEPGCAVSTLPPAWPLCLSPAPHTTGQRAAEQHNSCRPEPDLLLTDTRPCHQ